MWGGIATSHNGRAILFWRLGGVSVFGGNDFVLAVSDTGWFPLKA